MNVQVTLYRNREQLTMGCPEPADVPRTQLLSLRAHHGIWIGKIIRARGIGNLLQVVSPRYNRKSAPMKSPVWSPKQDFPSEITSCHPLMARGNLIRLSLR